MPALRLNLIGAGRVGSTLTRLWTASGRVRLQAVCGRDQGRAEAAAAALAPSGSLPQVVSAPDRLGPADLWLLTVPDQAIAPLARVLADCSDASQTGVRPVVLHCSGFLPAAALAPLAERGWAVASAHPALSFADPQRAAAQFAGTACALEGDPVACAVARRLFEAVGGRCFELAAADKPLYHAAAVFSSNFAPVLQALAAELWQATGMPAELVGPLWQGFVRQVGDNLLALGPAAALTGPAARGERAVVEAETAALAALDPVLAQAYQALSILAARLASQGSVLAAGDDIPC
jgi:predicted short-subunit dehydrogenase-like oxidoreductase (DUF2520 family)